MNERSELSTFANLVLGQINQAVEASGDVIEGNLFYHHQTKQEPTPAPSRQHKRKNFLLAIESANNLLEIGFNAGHSAFLALSRSPTLNYLGVDIALNKYSKPCFASRVHKPIHSMQGTASAPAIRALMDDAGRRNQTAMPQSAVNSKPASFSIRLGIRTLKGW